MPYAVEENLRGKNERMNDRMKDRVSGFLLLDGSIYDFYHCIMTVESLKTLRLNSLGIGGGINAICHNLKDLGTGASPRFSPETFQHFFQL